MNTNRITTLSLFVLLTLVSVGFTAIPAAAQPPFPSLPGVSGGGYGYSSYYYLSDDLVQYLGLSADQARSIRRLQKGLEFDLDDLAARITPLDDQVYQAQNNTSLSPAAIGLAVGRLIEQRVTLVRQGLMIIADARKVMLGVFNAQQLNALNGIINQVSNANRILNLASSLYGANLASQPTYSVGIAGLVPGDDAQHVEMAVTRVKVERAAKAVEEEFRKRGLSLLEQ